MSKRELLETSALIVPVLVCTAPKASIAVTENEPL
jgi:hypothetical protein